MKIGKSILLLITIVISLCSVIMADNITGVNVKDLSHVPRIYGDGVTDDTAAINALINSVPWGTTLYFPSGTYNVTGIVLTKTVNLTGESKTASKIKNTSTTNPCITINAGVERGTIRDIGILGNGTQAFGADATSGKGIVFNNNAVCWNINNVWMRGHGDYCLFADGTGNVNNINITNCEIENSKKGIRFYQCNSSNQINAIYIKNCNISGIGTSGIELWGQSLGVENCTIQACKNVGILLDGSTNPIGAGHLLGCSINNNYFEQCNYGFIKCKSICTPYSRYILGLTVSNNFGCLNPCSGDAVDKSQISAVEVTAPSWYSYDNHQVGNFNFINNSISLSDSAYKAILNGNDVLTYTCMIQTNVCSATVISKYTGLGRAKILTDMIRRKIVKGITGCVSHTYTMDKSPNITAAATLIFDISNSSTSKITSISIPVSTDSTGYKITISKKTRSVNTFDSYASNILTSFDNQVGNQVLSYNFDYKANNAYSDGYLEISVQFYSPATYFYVGNLEIGYTD